MIISLDEFLSLRHTLPVLDVRSEGEFQSGHIPNAINIPLLNNQERIAVGTDYKLRGQLEAIKTGFRLVGPRLHDIIEQALHVASDREALVHCWRGGMRSAYFCSFVQMAGVKTHQLKGGYKAYRSRVQQSFQKPLHLMVIGGCTGSGKTEILRALATAGEQVIDLERLACHKGSVFGGLMMPRQPTTEQFENDLFEAINTLDAHKRIWIEDESIAIGKVFLPQVFWKALSESQVIEIKVDKAVRVQRLVNEYSSADPHEFLAAMSGIVKKLGGQHFKEAKEKLLAGDWPSAIAILLTYYDKAYQNGLSRKKQRIIQHIEWDGKDSENVLHHVLSVAT